MRQAVEGCSFLFRPWNDENEHLLLDLQGKSIFIVGADSRSTTDMANLIAKRLGNYRRISFSFGLHSKQHEDFLCLTGLVICLDFWIWLRLLPQQQENLTAKLLWILSGKW
jgi:hypothetical protein